MEEKRFAFGKNWLSFLDTMDEERINTAVNSLKEMLEIEDLKEKTFLDIGCGSGLFSLAAVRLGAKVFSFDYDEESAACAMELRKRYAVSQEIWKIEKGSVLDAGYMNSLPDFDIVYSWGVLHHTGDMRKAIENASLKVKPNGIFFLALYNDQGFLSFLWKKVKEIYCSSLAGKIIITAIFVPFLFFRSLLSGLFKNGNPLYQFSNYRKNRGMSLYHDWIDWLGGYPFETALPKDAENFLNSLGFNLKKSKLTQSWGCNEFVFIKNP